MPEHGLKAQPLFQSCCVRAQHAHNLFLTSTDLLRIGIENIYRSAATPESGDLRDENAIRGCCEESEPIAQSIAFIGDRHDFFP